MAHEFWTPEQAVVVFENALEETGLNAPFTAVERMQDGSIPIRENGQFIDGYAQFLGKQLVPGTVDPLRLAKQNILYVASMEFGPPASRSLEARETIEFWLIAHSLATKNRREPETSFVGALLQ